MRSNCARRALGRSTLPLLCLFASMLAGCYAGIRAGEVTADKPAVQGVRYSLPAPYLIVEQTAKGQVDAKIHYLADRRRVFYVDPIVVLASQKAEIELNADGTLKSFKLEQDSTTVSAAVVQGVKDVTLKKLDIEKADAEERAKQSASASERLDDKNARVWIFALRGAQAERILAQGLAVPPASGGGGSSPSGKIEGTFSVTMGSAKQSSTDQKLTALRRPGTGDVSISHSEHKFTNADLETEVTLEGISRSMVAVVDGDLIVREADIPATGAKVKYRNEEVRLIKPSP